MLIKRLLVIALAVSLVGLTACSNDKADTGTEYVVTVNMDTAKAPHFVTHDVGAEKQIRFGSAQLVGKAELAGEPVDVELLCIINYLKGNGPFEGFWTFTAANGDLLSLTYSGTTEQRDGVGHISGRVKVLGGTGKFEGVAGNGTVTGQRDGSFGSGTVIAYTIDLHLDGLAA